MSVSLVRINRFPRLFSAVALSYGTPPEHEEYKLLTNTNTQPAKGEKYVPNYVLH